MVKVIHKENKKRIMVYLSQESYRILIDIAHKSKQAGCYQTQSAILEEGLRLLASRIPRLHTETDQQK